jgi:AAA+ superfamily predicted ATPase
LILPRAWHATRGPKPRKPQDVEFDSLVNAVEELSSRENAERVMNDAFHNCPIEELFIKRGEDTYISMKPLEDALRKELEKLKRQKRDEEYLHVIGGRYGGNSL